MSSKLYNLIQKLTPKEKSYIVLRFNNQKAYQKKLVFHTLNKQKQLNIDKLAEKIGCQGAILRDLMSSVYGDALRYSREYYSNKSDMVRMYNFLNYAHFLSKKGLYRQGMEELNKLRKLAKKHQRYDIIQQANLLAFKICFREMVLEESSIKVKPIATPPEALVDVFANLVHYWQLLIVTLPIVRTGSFLKSNDDRLQQLDLVINSPLIQNKSAALSEEARVLSFYIKMLYLQISGESKAAMKMGEQMITTLESVPFLIKDNPILYVKGLNALCLGYMIEEKPNIKKAIFYLNKLKAASFKDSDMDKLILGYYYPLKLILERIRENFGEALQVLQEIKTIQEEQDIEIIISETFSFFSGELQAYQGNYEEAIRYVQPLAETSTYKFKRDDLVGMSKLLYLVCLYGMGETRFLVNKSVQVYTFLKNHKLLTEPIDKMLLSFFKKADSYVSKKEAKQAEIEFREQARAYKKEYGKRGFLLYFDFLYCLDNKD